MKKGNYVDGFLLIVPKKNLAKYKNMAKKAAKIWFEYGALDYRECMGDDLNVQFGLPFSKLTKCKANEVVVFSWIVYKNKAHRNSVNKKVMKDVRLSEMCTPETTPFEVKRMSYGGFKIFVG